MAMNVQSIIAIHGRNYTNEQFYPDVHLTACSTDRDEAHAFCVSGYVMARNSSREVNVYLSAAQAREFAWALFVAANGGDITPLHPITNAAFLESSLSCPVCGSADTVGEEIEVEGDDTVQEVYCNDCHARWQEVYKLVGYKIKSEEDRDVESDD